MATIDLSHHAVIQASAGTGKTYAIEQLVLQLLTETDVSLDQILVVTYTEKATGDLKGRLRARLETALHDHPDRRARLQEALDGFDQAAVYTIHGFCQRMLQVHAFENRQDFRPQLIRDADLLETCLREMQRKDWWREYGDLLSTVLELSAYNTGKTGGEDWEDLTRQLAESFRPACGHVLLPELLEGWPAVVQERDAALRDFVGQMRRWAGSETPLQIQNHPWYVGFSRLPGGYNESRRDKLLVPLLEWLADPEAEERPLVTCRRFLRGCDSVSSFQKHGFLLLTEQMTKPAKAQFRSCCPNLWEAVEELERQRGSIDWSALDNQLAVQSVVRLQKQLAVYKRERGLQSFEDMLTRLDEALNPHQNPGAAALRDGLRQRYKYAIVDEFQDTDPIQWNIFRRIFVEGADGHRLVVVGDPKQAIFGFRGADVETYLDARDDLKNLNQAAESYLDVNWRSCPELLEALNRLFDEGGWFEGTRIDYTPVGAPAKDAPYHIVPGGDRTGRPALSLVDLTGPRTLGMARYVNAHFIAHEIRRLLQPVAGQPVLEFVSKHERRHLQAGDICVLVFKRREAWPLLDALREIGIRYTFYKEPGLGQSDEAIHLGYLLRAVARPEDGRAFRAALLTRFFRIPPEALAQADELPPDHRARQLFQEWCGHADKRRWAELFRSFLEDTGVLFHHMEGTNPERARANYRHLLQTLEQVAYRKDLDILGLVEAFEEMQRRPTGEDGDLQPVETERPRVSVMTVHASKGLEFPVVFLAGGFTAGRPPAVLTYRGDDRKLVFDLRGGIDDVKEKYEIERDGEQRRLLYVALTRAMFKLYLPRLACKKEGEPDAKRYTQPGPVVTILAESVEKSRLEELGHPVVDRIDPHGGDLESPSRNGAAERRLGNVREMDPSPLADAGKPVELTADLFPVLESTRNRRVHIWSFSSLHRRSRTAASPSYGERPPRADDDRPDALAEADSLRGPVFGDMVHDTLAEIDFAAVGAAAAPPELLRAGTATTKLIEASVVRHLPRFFSRLTEEALRQACRGRVAELVWHGLHTPLLEAAGPLWQVPARDRLHELEFHFPLVPPTPAGDRQPPRVAGLPPEVRQEDLFLTGFMDLVFRRDGRYFLVDWKTNTLPGYSPDHLEQSMVDSDYVRQYRLYLQALERWLRWVHGADFDVRQALGGVYYLYLRGLEAGGGVFFHPLEKADLRPGNVLGD